MINIRTYSKKFALPVPGDPAREKEGGEEGEGLLAAQVHNKTRKKLAGVARS